METLMAVEMEIKIRPYKESDYEMIASWWSDHGEVGPRPGMMVEDGTFVLELGSTPVMSITVFLTQSKEVAYLEGLISAPYFTIKEARRIVGQELVNHAYAFAKSKGYKRVICYTDKPKLANRYQELGMSKSIGSIQALFREL
jgi:rRNA processing protein Gar1